MILKRNLLCIKKKEKLELGEFLLYEPYKNILRKFVDLVTRVEAKDFDPVAKIYDGLLSAPPEIKEYYEALLGITSFYQHSQGGRGKYIEKTIASAFESCSLDIKLSEFPLWLEHPTLHKKKGIFTINGLSTREKEIIRKTPWDWLGDKDESTDVGTILAKEKTVVLAEVKNRVDSGGSAARREIWTSQKFGVIVNYLLRNEEIYRKDDKKFSLATLLNFFDIRTLELFIGILFDKGDRPATITSDKRNGFYSSSKEGFLFLSNYIKTNKKVKILNEDLENLKIEVSLPNYSLNLKIEALYGDDVTLKLFRKKSSVSDLLLLKYDDIWLSQLLAIDERTCLLKYGKNFLTIFKNLVKRDKNLRILYANLINQEGDIKNLKKIIKYLFEKYSNLFANILISKDKNKEEYLADVIQMLAAAEA